VGSWCCKRLERYGGPHKGQGGKFKPYTPFNRKPMELFKKFTLRPEDCSTWLWNRYLLRLWHGYYSMYCNQHVCLSVCLSAFTQTTHAQTSPNFLRMLPVPAALVSSNDNVIYIYIMYSGFVKNVMFWQESYGNSHAMWDHTVAPAALKGDIPAFSQSRYLI